MTHTAGVAPAIRQLHPQLGSGQSEPIAHAEVPTPAITGPDAGRTPFIALRRVNTQKLGKAKPRELAPRPYTWCWLACLNSTHGTRTQWPVCQSSLYGKLCRAGRA